jgi:tetratricopeptide (TPR) repeat protein
VATLERALESHPGEPLLDVRYAEIVEAPAGRLREAEARLRRAAAREPYLAAAWRALGRVLEAAKRPDEARAAYQSGLEGQPRDASLHAALGLLLAGTAPAPARRHLGEAVALAPSPSLEVLNTLADLHDAAGESAPATRARERVLEQPASTPEDRHQRATALRALGRGDEAEATWRALATDAPDYAPGWQGVGAAAMDRKAWTEAARASRRAVELDPELAPAWNILAIATEESEGKAAAVPHYRRAIEADPRYWQASFNLGLVLRDLGRSADAAAALEAVLETAPLHARCHYELGLLYGGELDDPARARRHLETALRAEPGNPRAAEARELLGRLP